MPSGSVAPREAVSNWPTTACDTGSTWYTAATAPVVPPAGPPLSTNRLPCPNVTSSGSTAAEELNVVVLKDVTMSSAVPYRRSGPTSTSKTSCLSSSEKKKEVRPNLLLGLIAIPVGSLEKFDGAPVGDVGQVPGV